MSSTAKLELLKADAIRAIDAIANDTEIDDDTREELFEGIEEYLEEKQRMLSEEGDDEEEEEEEDDDEEDDDEEDDGA